MKRTDHETTVNVYVQAVESLRRLSSPSSKGTPYFVGVPESQAKEASSKLWSLLRTTNLFEFDAEILSVLTNSFINHITENNRDFIEKIAGEQQAEVGGKLVIDYQDARLAPLINNAGRRTILPENRPFDCLYFAYGPGAVLNSQSVKLDPQVVGYKNPVIVAHLVAPNGDVYMLVALVDDPHNPVAQDVAFIPVLERKDGVWLNPLSMAAFIVPWLINYINEHRTIVEDKTTAFSYRRTYKAGVKRMKSRQGIPPPYYLVPLKMDDVHIYRERGDNAKEIEWTCRRKRRGHERLTLRRGKLPLDAETEAKLRYQGRKAKGDFELFTVSDASPRAAKALARRGHWPKRPDEWLSVIYTWIDDVVWPKDRPDLPLIEAVRRPTRQPTNLTTRHVSTTIKTASTPNPGDNHARENRR